MKGAALMVMKTVINEFYIFSALVEHGNKPDMEQLFLKVAAKYKECMHDMNGRSPGPTTMFAVHNLKPNVPKGYQINFNPRYLSCTEDFQGIRFFFYSYEIQKLSKVFT